MGNRADSVHLKVNGVPMSSVYSEYLKTAGVLSGRAGFSEHDAVLAFDHTDEDFYGELEDIWLHSWTGEYGVTGKFHFLTCSLVGDDVPQRVPLLSIPVRVGYNTARDVTFCIDLVRPLFKSVKLCLFDRDSTATS